MNLKDVDLKDAHQLKLPNTRGNLEQSIYMINSIKVLNKIDVCAENPTIQFPGNGWWSGCV